MKRKSLIILTIALLVLAGISYLFLQVSDAQVKTAPSASAKLPIKPGPQVKSAALTKPGPYSGPIKKPIVTEDAKKAGRKSFGLPAPSASKSPLLAEGFEGGVVPPANWTAVVNNPYTWEIETYNPYEGVYYAVCYYDQDYTGTQDEWLVSPVIDLTTKGSAWHLYFYWEMSYYWGVSPYDNYNIEVWISTDGGNTFPTMLWTEPTTSFSNFTWYKADVDLASYLTQNNVKLGFRYYGYDGAEAALDYITVDTEPVGRCCYGDPQSPTCADVTSSACTGLGGTWTDGLNCTDNPCPIAGVGDNCSAPIVVSLPGSLPYSDLNQTTCGRLDDYNNTCLGSYDGGEDIIYRIDVTAAVVVDITMNPYADTWTGMALDDACPLDPSTCLYMTTGSSGVRTLTGVSLVPGTYYLMIDTWPTPTCITTFDLTITAAAGPPPNDNCANATAIGDVTNLAFSTSAATLDGPQLCQSAPNIWYCYTATCTGEAHVSLCGSSYDTKLGVYDGCSCPPTTMLGCNDDACYKALQSELYFSAVSGNQYLIEVGGYGSNTGSGVLTTSCTAVTLPNDNCDGAIQVYPPETVSGTTIGATIDCPGYLDWPAVWYKVELPYDCNNLFVDFCPMTIDLYSVGAVIFNECPPDCPNPIYYTSGEFVSCLNGTSNAQIWYKNLPAGMYWIPIWVEDYDYNQYMDFSVSFAVEECVQLPGDVCATALVVPSLPYNTTGNSCDYNNDYDEACPYTGGTAPDVVYSYSPAIDQAIDIILCPSLYDTKVYVYEDVCQSGTYVGCNDDACGDDGYKSAIYELSVYAGHTYYVVVDGYGSSCGDYDLTIREHVPCVVTCPPNGIPENEPICYDDYEDVSNGGCNSTPPVFNQTVNCKDTICGTSGYYSYYGSGYRDTDWFPIMVSEGDLTFTCVAEFPVQILLIDPGPGDCSSGSYTIVASALGAACDTVTLTYYVTGGTWWLWVGPQAGLSPGPVCGSKYVFWTDCLPFGPQIAWTPTSFDQTLNPTGACSTKTDNLLISSVGGEDLNWSIAENPPVNWLAESPLSGTLPPGETATLDVSFDAGGMAPGDYNTNLEITSDAPKGVVTVPVHLKVELPPEIDVIPRLWVPVIPGCSMDKALRVDNLGTGELKFEVKVQGSPPPLGAPKGTSHEGIFNLVPNRNAGDVFKSNAHQLEKSNLPKLTTSAPRDVSKAANVPSGPTLAPKNKQDVIWDNGGTISGGNALSSQLDQVYPFVSQIADDFIFTDAMDVTDVHWWGAYWNGTALDYCDFYIYIYADDGTGNAPTGGGMPDPSPTALATYFFTGLSGQPEDPNGFREYNVTLSPPFSASANVKYWIAIQAVFPFPPQWGWAQSGIIQLHDAMQGFPLLGNAFWTLDNLVDLAFYLTGEPGFTCPMSVSPEEGTIPAESFFDVFLTFDGTAFENCALETTACYLVFTSNDCDESLVTVPVYMWAARGDVNGDCRLDVVDVVFLLNYIFIDGPAPDPLCVGDVDRSGGDPNSDDVLYLISYLFLYGPPPAF